MKKYLIAAILLSQFFTLDIAMAQFSVGTQKPQSETPDLKDNQKPSDMYSCSKDDDCIVVGSGCTIIAVNKAFESEGEVFSAKQNTLVECERDPNRQNKSDFSATCKQNKCVLY